MDATDTGAAGDGRRGERRVAETHPDDYKE